jgi:hypothetical protein
LKDNPKIMEKAVVTVDVDQLDVEAMWYARRLVNVLKMGGLNAKLDPAIYAYPPDSSPFVGLGFSGKPGSPQAGTIFAALRESGIVSNWAWEQPDWDETALSIRVGHKPEK